ncbi:MAG: sulfite exporter TauE/SafE family protein [Ferruginibacter sp.]
MYQLLIAATAMGMLGSFHCVGMCGPLALSLPLKNDSAATKFFGAMLYNSGRIVTYAVFGLVFGLIGTSVALFGYQQWLSVILGISILVFMLLPKKITAVKNKNSVLDFFEKLRQALGQLFFKKTRSSLFAIGLLNGLLPCGLVYMAAAGAVATGDLLSSVLFMAFFGLGTLPVMWSIAFFGNYVSMGIRQRIRKLYPYMMLLMACLLILRGMGLGIPYVSPKTGIEKKVVHECYAIPGK